MQYTQKPFRPLVTREQRLTLSTSIQSIALDTLAPGGKSVRITNNGAHTAYFSITNGTDASLTIGNGISLLPNTVECFWVADEMTHISFIGDTGANSVIGVTVGEGS